MMRYYMGYTGKKVLIAHEPSASFLSSEQMVENTQKKTKNKCKTRRQLLFSHHIELASLIICKLRK